MDTSEDSLGISFHLSGTTCTLINSYLSKSIINNKSSECIDTRHAFVKDRQENCNLRCKGAQCPKKTCWKQELERTHRKHVKYICTLKDEEHAFRHSAKKTMLVYGNHNLTFYKERAVNIASEGACRLAWTLPRRRYPAPCTLVSCR